MNKINNMEQENMTSTFEIILKNDRQKLKSLDIIYYQFIQSVKGFNPNIEEDLEIIYKIFQKSRINITPHRFEDFVKILEYMKQHIED